MRLFAGTLFAILASLLLMTCHSPLAPPGVLTLVGATRTTSDAVNGFVGSVDCSPPVASQGGEHATEVGSTSYCRATVRNSSAGSVTIQGAELLLLDTSSNPPLVSHFGNPFNWAASPPNLPVTLAPGDLFSFAVAFSPTHAGIETGSIELTTSTGTQQVGLSGEGGWIVTLKSDSSNGYTGTITQPIRVPAGTQATYVSVAQTFTLEAQTDSPLGFTILKSWTGGPNSAIANPSKSLTKVTVTGNDTITAVFSSPYVFVEAGATGSGTGAPGTQTNPVATLAQGVTALAAGVVCSPCNGIAMSVGTYNLTAATELPVGTIRGGYNVGFTARSTADYQSASARLDPATGTVIQTNGYDFLYNGSVTSGIDSATLLEGVAVIAGDPSSAAGARSDSMYAGIGIENGATPTLRYDTFEGGGGSSPNSIGVYVYSASPTIDSSLLSGSATSATGGRSVGLWVNLQSAPSISNDDITAGSATGANGVSYGILNENFAASPQIVGCTIVGGNASSTSAGVWTAYGGRPSFVKNVISTGNKAPSDYGVYVGASGALAELSGNNIFNASTALLYDYASGQSYGSIAEVNANYVASGQTPNTSVAP